MHDVLPRSLLLGLLCSSLLVAVEPRHVFTVDELRVYRYELTQTVVQQVLDDELTFTSSLRWTLALRCASAPDPATGAQELVVTLIEVAAEQHGPASAHRYDSSEPTTANDPLLGHLAELTGRSLTLRWHAAEQRLLEVSGGAPLIDVFSAGGRHQQRARNAERWYGDAALTRLWTRLLLRPGQGEQTIPAPAPLAGTLQRRWQADGSYELAVAPDTRLEAVLAEQPTRLAAHIDHLAGSGAMVLDTSGLLQRSSGRLSYDVVWDALTMDVAQHQQIRWQLDLVDHGSVGD